MGCVQRFQFFTSLALQESTGLRAATLADLARLLRGVSESSIYFHTHHFLLQHHYLTPEPPNDFAYWVTEVLGEETLGELLAGIDTVEYCSLKDLRDVLVNVVEGYLSRNPTARLRFAGDGQEFFFMKCINVIMPTGHSASTLQEFADALGKVSIRSLYFHIFDARLRLGKASNDFALWIDQQLGLKQLAQEIAQLDPYAHTLETLRSMVLSLIRQELYRAGRSHG